MLENYAATVMRAMQGAPIILVAAGVALITGKGEILLLKGHDGVWDLPGGHMEIGESLEETASREVLEETGLTVDALDLLGIASGRRIFHKERNAYYVTAFYRAHAYRGEVNGEINLSREHADGKFFAPDALPDALSVSVQYLLELLRA